MTPPPYVLTLLDKLPEFEGAIAWMYLDSVGKVTVAEGLMVPDVSSALALPFQFAGAIAEPGDIRADFLRVEKMKPCMAPGFYHCATSVTLTHDYMRVLALRTLVRFDGFLRSEFPSLDSYPDVVKPAMLDMIYNLGPGRLQSFHQWRDAVLTKNWAQAAATCHRRQISADRNAWAAAQFLAGATVNV